MPSIEVVLVESWWDASGCRPVVIAESTFRYVRDDIFGGRFNQADARAFAGLVTGLDLEDQIGVDVDEFARACAVTAFTVEHALAELRDAGLVRRHHRGAEPRTGRRGWAWQLSGGLLHLPDGASALRIEPRFDPARSMVELHARPHVNAGAA